jgi:hypothetical protein
MDLVGIQRVGKLPITNLEHLPFSRGTYKTKTKIPFLITSNNKKNL